jgi:hypothetical protein
MYHCPELETFIHSNRSRYRLYKPLDIDWVTIKSMLQVI